MENQEQTLGGFDPHVVHLRNSETGRVTKVNAYRLIVHKGTRYFEWPKSSGNLWYENREPAGILSDAGDPIIGEKHKEWVPPVSEDDKLAARAVSLEQENKRLQAELTAIKKEAEADKLVAASKPSQSAVKSKAQAKPKEVKASPEK